ncbi:MAG TPA: hypothetical protein VMM56_04755, partial [Planctomycetaceae bacterium]|nr:hypothetical protein [Planctomycetaceae bacterium]
MSLWLSRVRLLSRVFILVWVTCAASRSLHAQPILPEKTTPSEPAKAPDSVPLTGDVIYLKDESGRPVPVPLNASLKKYLESLEQPTRTEQAPAPEFSLDSLSMQGVVGDGSVDLETKIQITISSDKRGVFVPLQFKEGILKDVTHTGPGESMFAEYQSRTGYRWWLKGAGKHEITLKLNVPVLKQLQAQRLQITLPRTAKSSLKLTVPYPEASFKVQEKTSFMITPAGASSVIELFGLGENFDLSWEAAVDRTQTAPILRARTDLSAELQPGTVLLKARQQLNAVQGQFREIDVRVPLGFKQESMTVEGTLLESVSEIAGKPGWKKVTLASMTSGPVDLIWVFSSELPLEEAVLRIGGFELGGAVRQQAGTIALGRLPGYLIRERSSRAVFRRDVPPTAGQNTPNRTYDFYRQPFELELELKKIPLSFEADVSLVLTVHPNRLQLDADLNLVRYRGLVETLELNWPHRLEEGWSISPSLQTGESESFSVDMTDESLVRLHFSEPLDLDHLRIRLTAERPFVAEGIATPLSLPRLRNAQTRDGISVIVQGRENLAIQLSPLSEAIPASLPAGHIFPEFYGQVETYRFPSEKDLRLEVSAEPQEGTVEVESTLNLEQPIATGLMTVAQQFDYRIRYERLRSLRFRVPPQAVNLKVFDEQGRALALEEGSVALDGSRQVRVLLSQPRLGKLTLRWEYLLNGVSGDASEVLEVPFVNPGEGSVTRIDASLSRELYEKWRPSGKEWKPLGQTRTFTRQTATQPVERLSILLSEKSPDRDIQIQPRISKSLILSDTDGRGGIRTRCYFSMWGMPEQLRIRIPVGYDPERVVFNGQDLPVADWKREAEMLDFETQQLVNHLGDGLNLLMIDVFAKDQQKLNWVDPIVFQAPEIVNSQGHAHTRWLVDLPYRQHLFLPPRDASSYNRWDRTGLFWERVPNWSRQDLSDWVNVERTDLDYFFSGSGNQYVFHHSGNLAALELRTMDRSLVILTGAGVTLVLGFFLLKFPATRNILTLLLLALAFAVCGIFYPTSIALLLQPAALGFCLALGAAALDRFLRSPKQAPILSLSNSSVHSERGSSQRSMVSFGLDINPEAQTEMRAREEPAE